MQIPHVRAAMRVWTLSASVWKTTMPSDVGAPAMATVQSTRAASCRTARSSSGPAQLKKILLRQKTAFVHCLCPEAVDVCAWARHGTRGSEDDHVIVRKSATDDYKFSALISGIVESELFRKQ